ncbi:polyamine aminopropyltransferase [Spirochaetota bacterium]
MSKKKAHLFHEKLNANFGYFYTYNKVLVKTKSKYQSIKLIDTNEFGKVLLLDSITQVGEKNDYLYHEPMVHSAMCAHPLPLDVLIIGGGDGGILREVLRHSCVRKVDMVDLDEKVVSFSKKYLPRISNGAFNNKKAHIYFGDGRAFVEKSKNKYDVIIMDVTDPFGPSVMLYTKESFTHIKNSFKNNKGIFTMHIESPISRPRVFNAIYKTLKSVFRYVVPHYIYIQMYAVLWGIGVSSNGIDISGITSSTLGERLRKRKVGRLHAIDKDTIKAMQVPYPYIRDILKNKARVVRDKDPYLQNYLF